MSGASPLKLACLCAAWCRTCDAYAATLAEVAAAFQARGELDKPRWIDIEDEADLVGDLDIETFPTLLVYTDECVRFAGPLTPQPETLRRLLANLLVAEAAHAPAPALADPGYETLRQRLLLRAPPG